MKWLTTYKAGVLFTAGLLFCLHAAPAQAQANANRDLMNRLDQVERQIQTMSRAVFRGDKSAAQTLAAQAGGGSAEGLAGFEGRLSQMEQDQRKLVNEIERLQFELKQMQDKMELLQAETQQSLSQPQALRYPSAAQQSGEELPALELSPEEAGSAPVQGDGSGLAEQHSLGTWSPSQGHRGEPETMYEDAFQHIKEAEYDEAEKGFRAFLDKYPDHPLAPNSQYWLGESYYVRGDYKMAAKAFAKGYQKFPNGAKAPDSLLKLSLSLAAMGKKEDACLSLRQLVEDGKNPNHPVQKRAVREMQKLNCQ